MKARLREIISAALDEAIKAGEIKERRPVNLERARREEFGDFATNIAMLLAPLEKRPPRDVASILAKRIASSPLIEKCDVAGPGFINIFLKPGYWHSLLTEVLEKDGRFGDSQIGGGRKVLVEFVSANPTGPLHIGHGRGAAVGDALSNILKAAGYSVTKEFYINDRGRQVETLGESVRAAAEGTPPPQDAYKGAYVKDIAAAYDRAFGAAPCEERPSYKEFACAEMLSLIKKDLTDFGVRFDLWKSELKDLFDAGLIDKSLVELKGRGVTFDSEGALWFRTTDFGDDKDRVLKKAGGELTYFAADAAYHAEKLGRGFDVLVDVWGADHHGYEARVRAVLKALGFDDKKLRIIFIQLVSLSRGGVPVAMGKREGEFVTLREVMDEVGSDATRFFFLSRKSDAQMDFDLELAKKQAPENPVFYVQYSHARINSIISFAAEKGVTLGDTPDASVIARLELKEELELIKKLGLFEEAVEKSAEDMEPHVITFYLQELAGLFHPYYNRNRVVTDDAGLTTARLYLCKAVAAVIKRGLTLLGVSAPAKM